jgi:hypothetical protein
MTLTFDKGAAFEGPAVSVSEAESRYREGISYCSAWLAAFT